MELATDGDLFTKIQKATQNKSVFKEVEIMKALYHLT
jgi:hypothetical protein